MRLTHLGLPAEFPKFKPAPQSSLYEYACGPPDDCQPDPQVDYEAIGGPLRKRKKTHAKGLSFGSNGTENSLKELAPQF